MSRVERPSLSPSLDVLTTIKDGKVGLRTGRILNELFPQDWMPLLRGEMLDETKTKELKDQFLGRLRRDLGVRGGERFWIKQLKDANDFIGYVVENSFPEAQILFGVNNEVAIPTDDPLAPFSFISNPQLHPIVRFEAARQVFLANIFAGINARTQSNRPHAKLHDINELFRQNLYTDASGKTEFITVEAAYTDSDNMFVVETHGTPPPYDGIHIKEDVFRVRDVKDIGHVIVHPRKKDDNSMMVKTLTKSLSTGSVDLNEVKADTMGMLFVSQREDQVAPLIDRVLGLLEENMQVTHVEDDDAPDEERGQSRLVQFRRKNVYLRGLQLPVELVFFSMKDYLNSLYQIGHEPTREDEHYNGPAHRLYELRRLGVIVPYLFPTDVYGGGKVSPTALLAARSRQIADELRAMNRKE